MERILIVEDNTVNQTLLTDILNTYYSQSQITLVDNGLKAVELLATEKFDIVIMDICMPILDGIQTTIYIRERLNITEQEMPILGLSAQTIFAYTNESSTIGLNAYISKPFEPKVLINKIKELLHTKQTLDENNTADISCQIFKYIDLSLLKKNYRNNQTKINKILHLCLVTIDKQLDELWLYCNNEDWERVKVIMHSIKIPLYYLGLQKISTLTNSIEESTNILEPETILAQIKVISQVWQKASLEIKQFLDLDS